MNIVLAGMNNCHAYIDDTVIHNDCWDEHLHTIREFFNRLSNAKLTVNLAKSEFGQATLTFLGHVVGQGKIKPVNAKVKAISEYPHSACQGCI